MEIINCYKKTAYFYHILFLLFFAGFILSFSSCRHQLLPMPGVSTSNDGTTVAYLGDVSAPKNLTATNGQKRKIVLSWGTDSNATHYYIYTAATPFDTFTKIAETTETQYEYTAVAGVTRYFKVSAVDYKNSESACSKIEKGTTLACPILSDIQSTEENGVCSSKLYWYMENVTAYQSLVRYTVNCYLNKELIQTGIVDGSQTSESYYTFEGLAQNVEYEYQVESYIVSAQNETEISDMLDERTIASMRPNPVDELTATEGSKPGEITLTFKLPGKSYIATKDAFGTSYSEYPLYFKIYSRPVKDGYEGEKNGGWDIKEDHLYFDGTTTGHGIDTTSMKEEDKKTAEDAIIAYFDKYEAGTELTWTEQVARGVKYEYKIESYVDNYTRDDYTTDSSVATAIGWAYKDPKFAKPKLSYEFNEDKSAKLSAKITYNFAWDNFGSEANYKYIVKADYGASGSDKTTSTLFETVEDVNAASVSFDLSKNDIGGTGDYFYTFYIVPGATTSETDISSALETIQITSKIHISSDPNEPYFPGLEVVDGYKDRVTISWEFEAADLIYNLYREGTLVKTVNPSDYTYTAGAKFSFTDTGLSPDETYVYALTGQRLGASEVFTCNDDLTALTLGVPVIEFDVNEASYDSVMLKWSPVQKAEKYTLFLGEKEITFTNTEHIEEGIVKCTVKEPEGYDDASKSGANIMAKVIAYSAVDSVSANENVYTLGPVLTSPTASVIDDAETITVTWKAVNGAKGYNVRRQCCSITNLNFIESFDVYAVSAEGVLVDSTYESAVDISFDESTGIFTLKDKFRVRNDEKVSWQANQEKIGWGLPFRYTVYPLKSNEDALDDDLDNGVLTEKLGGVKYKNFNDSSISPIGSAIGYGHNITASKSESPNKIYITWTPQYLGGATLTPNLMLRKHGTGDDYKKADLSKTKRNDDKKFFTYTLDSSERLDSFDFVVSYSQEADPEVDKAYVRYLDTLKDPLTKDLALTEPSNKGYAFAVNLTAANSEKNEGIAEEFHWNLWDTSKKAIGPEGKYLFEIKNNDYSPEWKTVCEIDLAGTMELNKSNYNITAKANGGKLNNGLNNGYDIQPTTEGEFGYDGLLKVLRDYRHYARLVATRKLSDDSVCYKTKAVDSSSSPIITASYHDSLEDDLFAYRQITDKEFTRAVTLIVADAIYQAGISSGGDRHCDGVDAKESSTDHKFLIKHPGGSKDIVWGTYGTTYQHIFRGGTPGNTNSLTSDFIIKIENCGKTGDAINGTTLYFLPSVNIEVTHTLGISSYQGKIEFSAGEGGYWANDGWLGAPNWHSCHIAWILSISKDGNEMKSIPSRDVQDETEFKKWFPYDIGTSHDTGIKSYATNAVVYSPDWW